MALGKWSRRDLCLVPTSLSHSPSLLCYSLLLSPSIFFSLCAMNDTERAQLNKGRVQRYSHANSSGVMCPGTGWTGAAATPSRPSLSGLDQTSEQLSFHVRLSPQLRCGITEYRQPVKMESQLLIASTLLSNNGVVY